MKKRSKRYMQCKELVAQKNRYTLEEAVDVIKQFPDLKFDESVDVSFNLGVDPKHADQMVRGTVVLPKGTGKSVRVLVFVQGEKAQEAKDAGADYVGYKELVEKIKGGWFDFDVAIATPDTMPEVGKLGRLLGPKGLMPSPKAGTVTNDVARAVKEVKAGRVEFRVDKQGNLHLIVGKKSFLKESLVENLRSVITTVEKARPSAVKGQYIRSMYVSTSMGPSVSVDVKELGLR